MSLALSVLLLIVGFTLLIKGADFLVDGASALAMKFRVSPLVIGLTIVSFGTSSPELIVNVIAAIKDSADLSFGNIIGSNIINILLILGIAAMIRPLQAQRNTVLREIPFSLMAVFAILFLCNDYFFSDSENILARNDGFVLLLFFIIFIVYTFGFPKIEVNNLPEIKKQNLFKIILYISLGLSGLLIGGGLVVDNAIRMAHYFGLSEKIIGLTIVAIGTSLPELFTSAVAAYKNNADIAIGNVVGSNIFNIFFILGVTSTIRPMPFDSTLNIDIAMLILASLALFLSVFAGANHRISRGMAFCFLGIYIFYTLYLFVTAS
ncbi:calcium/sodium antiporter [candidate division KSB1 bacterium]|nr:calcium/sodium antiporter [candidate division KSB1 bacterium]